MSIERLNSTSSPIETHHSHSIKNEPPRDQKAEVIQRIALGILGALVIFIPYLIPKFRNYIIYGPEIKNVPQAQKTDDVAKERIPKPPEAVSSEHVFKSNLDAAQMQQKVTKSTENDMSKPKPLVKKEKSSTTQTTYTPASTSTAKIQANKGKDIKELHKSILKELSKLDPPANEINAETCHLEKFLALLPGESTKYPKEAKILFNCMLKSILSDVHEEVIGQERPDGAIPDIIASELQKKHPEIENSDDLKRLAAELYPLALLTCYFHKDASIPDENIENLAKDDAKTFKREYEAQFDDDRSSIWTEGFMKECLAKVWDLVDMKRLEED